jgi:acyl carrier protein
MRSLVEPRVRRLAADHLGVEEDELLAELSLVEDLAADSLDLAELGLAIEDDLGVHVPEVLLSEVRTYGDLVETILGVVQAHVDAEIRRAMTPATIWARVFRPAGEAPMLERGGPLTPYTAETLADDVLRTGPGARLEVTVTGASDDGAIERVRGQFAWLAQHGVEVQVNGASEPGRHRPHPNAA